MISCIVKGRKISKDPIILLQWNDHIKLKGGVVKFHVNPLFAYTLHSKEKNKRKRFREVTKRDEKSQSKTACVIIYLIE